MNRLSEILKSSKPSSSSSLSPTPLHKRPDESDMWGVEASNDHVSFEHKFCSNFFCCNMRLPGMHELLEHVEEVHIMSPLAPPSHTSSADARPSHSNPGHSSLHRSPYDVVCAYPAPSTPPPLSQLFENEFDWSSTVYPGSQPDSPLIDVFPGLDEFSTIEDATYSSSLFGHHNESQQDLDISAGIPSSSQTSPNCIVSDSDSGAPENDTATTSVTLHAENSESMQKGAGSLSDPCTTSRNAVASTSGTVSGSKPPHSSLLSSSHATHAPLIHSSVYSSQTTAPYNSYLPSHISSSSHDQKVRSSGPSRRPKNKAARKLPVVGTTSTVAGTKTKAHVGGRSGLPSSGSRSLRGFNDLSLDDIATNCLGDMESGERTLKKGRIPIRREKKHRCPMPGCSKAYLNPGGLKYHLEKGTCKIELDQDGNDDSKDDPTFSSDLSIEDVHIEDKVMELESAQFSSTHADSPFISDSSLPPTSASLHDTENGSYDVQNSDSPVPLSVSPSSPASPHSRSVLTPSLTPEQLAAAPAPVSPSANSDHPDTLIVQQIKTFSHPHTSSNAHDPQGYEHPQQTTARTSDTSSSSESDEEGHNRHVVDSKKIHMPIPHVANAWRLEAFSDMSESDSD